MDYDMNVDSFLTSYQVAAALQVNPGSILNWVKAGHIPAFRTPGGHLRIRVGDLLSFLKSQNIPIPRALRLAAKRRLLIVDDDARQLKGLKRLLKPFSDEVEVELVSNGIDALVQVGAFRPHVIVLDVFMPEVDGIEVCRRLKTNPDTRAIDVIVASAQLTQQVEEQALKAGAKRCMQKPLQLKVVLLDLGILEATIEARSS